MIYRLLILIESNDINRGLFIDKDANKVAICVISIIVNTSKK